MKAIFTYPNNAATSYIDPLYVGDASDGFQKRIQDLKDGNYKSWDGTAPTDTVSDLMSNISKFNDYYNNVGDNNITIDDIYTYPLVTADLVLHNATINNVTFGSPSSPAIFTSVANHGFQENKLKVALSAFDGNMIVHNGIELYTSSLTDTTFNLYNDVDLTSPFYVSQQSGTTAVTLYATDSGYTPGRQFGQDDTVLIDISDWAGGTVFPDGQSCAITSVTYNGTGLLNTDYYMKSTATADSYELYQDSALTNPLLTSEVTGYPNTYGARLEMNMIKTNTAPFVDIGSTMQLKTSRRLEDWELDVYLPESNSEWAYTISHNIYGQLDTPYRSKQYMYLVRTTSDYVYNMQEGVVYNAAQFSNYISLLQGDATDQDKTLMTLTSLSEYAGPYNYNALLDVNWKTNIINDLDIIHWHWFNIHDGYTFDLISTVPSGNVNVGEPYTVKIINQPGKPVLDARPNNISFNGTSNILTRSGGTGFVRPNSVTKPWVIWSPLVNEEDHRTSFAQYENLNIQDNYAYVTNYANPTIVNAASGNNICMIVWLENDANSEIDPSQGTGAGYVTLAQFNTIFGTSYTGSSVIDVKMSPCPYDILDGGVISNGNRGWADTDPYYTGGMSPWINYIPETSSRYKLQANVRFKAQVGGNPAIFTSSNNITALPLNTGPVNLAITGASGSAATTGYVQATTVQDVSTSWYTRPYKANSVQLPIPANNNYTYQNSSNVATPGAETGLTYIVAGTNGENVWGSTVAPAITYNADGNGRLSSVSLDTANPGQLPAFTYPAIALSVQSLPDQYVPPAANTAADEDIFDTQDQWTNAQGINSSKEFGKNIIPTTASITYVQPSTTNMSQNGKKYVRSSGFVKTKLEVNYTNLTQAEFQELHADAQAARGQAAMFYLITRQWGRKVLNFNNGKSTYTPRLVEPVVAGETVMKYGGFMSNESEAFKKGEMLIGGGSENGGLLTVLNTVDANVYGEAKIRVAYGTPLNQAIGDFVFKDPYHIIVSLDSDEFQYTVDTFGLYNVTVTFETGSYS